MREAIRRNGRDEEPGADGDCRAPDEEHRQLAHRKDLVVGETVARVNQSRAQESDHDAGLHGPENPAERRVQHPRPAVDRNRGRFKEAAARFLSRGLV